MSKPGLSFCAIVRFVPINTTANPSIKREIFSFKRRTSILKTLKAINKTIITTSKNTKKSVPLVIPAILFPKLSEVDPEVLIMDVDKKSENSR